MTLSNKDEIRALKRRVAVLESVIDDLLVVTKHMHFASALDPPEFMKAWKKIFGEKG